MPKSRTAAHAVALEILDHVVTETRADSPRETSSREQAVQEQLRCTLRSAFLRRPLNRSLFLTPDQRSSMRSFLQVRSSDRNDPLFRERYLHMPNFAAFLLKLSQLYPDMFENTHVSVGSYLGFLEIPAISLEH